MIRTFTTEENRWLSNMWYVDIPLKGIVYPSVEHAYQSEKSKDPEWKKFCSDRDNKPAEVKKKSKEIIIREDWDDVKLLVMEHCLRQKFKNRELLTKLLLTGNENIQEGNYWGDIFWGVDLKSTPNYGENHLGRLIMKIRDEYQLELKKWKENNNQKG